MHPRLPSRSPSPIHHYPPSNPPIRHQDMYTPPQNPPSSASMVPRYDHLANLQAAPAEAPHPREPTLNQTGYPVTQPPPHRMSGSSLPWQQQQVPQFGTPGYALGYPTQTQHYPPSLPSSQSYHPGQAPGHPVCLPSTLGYQGTPGPGELQGMTEQLQPAKGEPTPGQGPGRVPAALGGSDAAHVANGQISGAASGAPAVSSVGTYRLYYLYLFVPEGVTV